jgi:hypothetical protein
MTREFILDTLLPYKQNPQLCGYDDDTECCSYLTSKGTRCVVGKYMKEGPWQKQNRSIDSLLRSFNLEEIFTDEALAQNIPIDIWQLMQEYHDNIAMNSRINSINCKVEYLEDKTGFDFSPLKF